MPDAVKRAAYCVSRIAYRVLRCELGLFRIAWSVQRAAYCVSRDWVRLGLFFLSGVERDIGVRLCGTRGCGDFVVWGIGFVLHKQGLILDAGYSILDALPVWRDWVCFGFVFSRWTERNIGVSLWGKRGCGDSGVLGIGFVLHN